MDSEGLLCAGSRIIPRGVRTVAASIVFGLSALSFAACNSSPPVVDEGEPQTASTSPSSSGSKPTSSSSGGMSVADAGAKTDAGGSAGKSGTSTGSATSLDAATAGAAAGGGKSAAGVGAAGSSGASAGSGGMSIADAGVAGSSGKSASMSGSMMDEDAGCVPPEKPLDVSKFPKCSEAICPAQDSVCFPISTLRAIASQETIDLLASCEDASNKCVPVEIASQLGRSLLTKCKSVNGAEGRCTSPCVPLVAQQASLLPKDVCTGPDLCAPCYDPRTGMDTLACRQGCDPGPTEPPKTFDKCCSDRGLCVPPALAGNQAKNLNKESCTADTLCAPKELADPTFKAKTCASIDDAEGRCISTCVGGAVAKQKDRLPTMGCGADEVCAPCYDPVTGEDTGACTVNGDKPAKPKQVFQQCCGTSEGQPVGVCVTPALAGSQASILRQETCPMGRLCAPVKKAQDPTFKFAMCSSLLGDGACVNHCIPDQTQAAILSKASCGTDELCAPCNLLGDTTHACD